MKYRPPTAEEKITDVRRLTVEDILNDEDSSNWLKTTLRNLEGRDIVDAVNDAEVLVTILSNEWRRQSESFDFDKFIYQDKWKNRLTNER